jgi:peptide/nickel transport system substrate-binding protein
MAADHADRLASSGEAPVGPSPIERPPGGRRRRWSVASVCVCVILSVAACGGSSKSSSSGGGGSGGSTSSSTSTASSGPAKPGGSLTVLESSGYAGDWPTGLDPASNTNGAADQSQMNAIFGQLWELQGNGHLVPDLATGSTFSGGGKTVTIKLRPGVRFSDGTPFNAAAVVFNWKRDLASPCTCKPILPPVASITAPSSHTVRIEFKVPDGAFVNQLQDSNFSWIASPAALKKMGEKAFKLTPVGAGPFTVGSDTLSNTLVLKKNPSYWKQGRPYLNGLTFKTTSGDETALEAMQSGQGDAYEGMSTQTLVGSFKSKFTVVAEPSTSPYDIQLNTKIPPFNDKRARLAIYYATDTQLLDQKLFGNQYKVVQGFTAPGGLFYSPTVPGYPTYNLAKAKALVKQLGGLNINYFTISQPATHDMMVAMQQMWKQAGINASIHFYSLATLIQQFQGKWQIAFQTAGAWDPAGGVGLAFRFVSNSPFSGVHDPKLDNLILGAAGAVDPAARKKLYDQAAQYIAQNAYGPFLFPISNYNIASHGVQGPGLTTPIPSVAVNTEILWEEVSKS